MLEKRVKKEIEMLRKLGEHARKGSDHFIFRSISKFELSKPVEIIYNNQQVYESICQYDIYTETEFLHPPEMDEEYTEYYRDKFIFNKKLKLLEIRDVRKN
jgi:hypothetical protein